MLIDIQRCHPDEEQLQLLHTGCFAQTGCYCWVQSTPSKPKMDQAVEMCAKLLLFIIFIA